MEYTKLGNSDIQVSRLCVGCMSFGDPASKMHAWTLDPQESGEIVKHALGLGINFFDTANTYSAGTSEKYLGRAIKDNIGRDRALQQRFILMRVNFLRKPFRGRWKVLSGVSARIILTC